MAVDFKKFEKNVWRLVLLSKNIRQLLLKGTLQNVT